MTFEEFLAKQEEIYAKFRAQGSTVRQQGLTPDAAAKNEHGGYIIAWKHPQPVARAVADLSQRISETVSAMVYTGLSVHTTLALYEVAPKFRVDPKNPEHDDVLRRLCLGVQKVLGDIRAGPQRCEIAYSAPWLYNQTTVIAQGIPNIAFMLIGDAVRNACQEQGIVVRPPWGAHITVSRFRETVNSSRTEPLIQLLRSTPPVGMSIPEALEVGFFSMEGGDLTHHVYTRFPLEV